MPKRKKTAREQFLDRLEQLEKDVSSLSSDLRADFQRLVNQHDRAGEIVFLQKFDRATQALLVAYIIEVSDLTIDANVDVARIGAQNEYAQVTKALKTSGLTASQQGQLLRNYRNQILNYPAEVRKRITTRRPFEDNRAMPYRFKTVLESAQKTVRNILDLGIKNRESSLDIAKKIQQYIKPTQSAIQISPKDVQRERFGLTPESNVTVRGGSVDYNSMRIARTETQRTYRHVPEEINKDKAFVKGYKWNLSRAHPKTDICDDLATANKDDLGPGVYKETPDSHPNCICTITTVLISDDELHQLFEG